MNQTHMFFTRRFMILVALAASLTISKISYADFADGRVAYQNGDFETAFKEWTPLAVYGDAEAQFLVGSMYDKGQGVLQDHKTAVGWYTLAADQGHVHSQYNLGLSYQYGQGVSRDYLTALIWYKLAAEHGNSEPRAERPAMYSMYNLGVMYANGEGVTQDYTLAHMWWTLCAAMGSQDAEQARHAIGQEISPFQLETSTWLAEEWRAKYMQ